MNTTSHAAGDISRNAYRNLLPLLAYSFEKLCRYIEHVFTSVTIKNRNRDKVKIEGIYFPIDMDSGVEVKHALMSRHVESNREIPDTRCHEHLRNLLQAQRTNKANVSTHSHLVDAADQSESRLLFHSANNAPNLSKFHANSKILNSEV